MNLPTYEAIPDKPTQSGWNTERCRMGRFFCARTRCEKWQPSTRTPRRPAFRLALWFTSRPSGLAKQTLPDFGAGVNPRLELTTAHGWYRFKTWKTTDTPQSLRPSMSSCSATPRRSRPLVITARSEMVPDSVCSSSSSTKQRPQDSSKSRLDTSQGM